MELKKLTKEDVKITLAALQEDTSIEGAASELGEVKDDFIKIVREARKKSKWGWCTVRLEVTYKGFSGTAYLGECSYASKEDFISNSGYYESMLNDALADINGVVSRRYDEIKGLLVS